MYGLSQRYITSKRMSCSYLVYAFSLSVFVFICFAAPDRLGGDKLGVVPTMQGVLPRGRSTILLVYFVLRVCVRLVDLFFCLFCIYIMESANCV